MNKINKSTSVSLASSVRSMVKISRKKRKIENKIILIFIILFVLIIAGILILIKVPQNYLELTIGNPAIDFCKEKCGTKKLQHQIIIHNIIL